MPKSASVAGGTEDPGSIELQPRNHLGERESEGAANRSKFYKIKALLTLLITADVRLRFAEALGDVGLAEFFVQPQISQKTCDFEPIGRFTSHSSPGRRLGS